MAVASRPGSPRSRFACATKTAPSSRRIAAPAATSLLAFTNPEEVIAAVEPLIADLERRLADGD
jgi:hypothetical protein